MTRVFRCLVTRPGFASIAVITVGLGAGALLTMLSVTDRLFFEPLPYREADRLVAIAHFDKTTAKAAAGLTLEEFISFRLNAPTLENISYVDETTIQVQREDGAVPVRGAFVSETFFQLLGVAAAQGRVLVESDYDPAVDRAIVLGHRFWREYFRGDPALIGRRINGTYTVIGIMPPRFDYPEGCNFWLPASLNGAQYNAMKLRVLARLRPHASIDSAQAEIANIFERDKSTWYWNAFARLGITVEPLREAMVGHAREPLVPLIGAAICVFAVACLNVANLFGANAIARSHEIWIRRTLGAGRLAAARHLIGEGMLLSTVGALLGVVIAHYALELFRLYPPIEGIPRVDDLTLSVRTAGAALMLVFVVVAAVLCGVLPLVADYDRRTGQQLRVAPGFRAGRRTRVNDVLVVTQLSVSLVLVTCAAVLIRSFVMLTSVTLGFDPSRILVAETSARDEEIQRRAIERFSLLPSVQAAAAATSLPSVGPTFWTDLQFVDAVQPAQPRSSRGILQHVVTPGYFRAIGIPVLKGRVFDHTDTGTAEPVAVVNETLERTFFPGEGAVGKRMLHGPRIIGVVADVRNVGVSDEVVPEVYFPHTQARWWSYTNFVLRTSGDPGKLAALVRQEYRALDPNRRVAVRPMQHVLGQRLARQRSRTFLTSVFGMIALVVAGVGVHAIVSQACQQRRREFGLRMAVGATRAGLVSLVLRHGCTLGVAGLLLGLPCAVLSTQWLRVFLYGLQPIDPAGLVAAGCFLLLVVVLATWLPARRAAKLDPAVTLRAE